MVKNWFFLSILAVIAAFSQADGHYCSHWEKVVGDILANGEYCVQAEKGGKIYLNPENITVHEEGMYLDLNGRDAVPLSAVFSDEGGCFVLGKDYFGEPPMPVYCPKCKFFHPWPPCGLQED